ncbi:ABC transporter ATP-binding protein [Limibacillus halophilus]|uniref:ABC-type branched-subunit amino acid transport system ATPase component n=1 Tax=Limibacillus halophilus TaxID=1579333 RepID=A0A839SXF9_9PROT|nr:ABC transporter ATP-binding protein [Limibacillus halophilus]MBB3066759.1 ABC-type branched-subunit amino acid transport system ATPase component [Limibacillus halophilus]
MTGPLLAVEGLCAGYGKGDIIKDVTFELSAGSITTIIGPNGAGKSTLIKTLAGVVRPRIGSVRVDGDDLTGMVANRMAAHGVAYVPQEANVFRTLTVQENLEMGAWTATDTRHERMEHVFELFPVLQERSAVRAGNLSGGQRQMAAFGMAMMVAPRLLLLDEPSAGLSPKMVGQMFETVRRVNETGVGVLMVEQNAIQGLGIADRGIVMAAGEIKLNLPASELLDNAEVGELYLGTRQ